MRAIAVLSVVGYHAFSVWIPGGFIGAAGFSIYQLDGVKSRSGAFFQNDIAGDIGHQEFLNYLSVNFFSCDLAKSPSNSRFQREELPCLLSQDSEIVDVALIGDSHAGHLLLGFIENLREVNVTYYPINRLPIVDEEDFLRV